jgi:predicted phosphoribosyltransferase
MSFWCAKSGVRQQPELALGAVVGGTDPQVLINEGLASELAVARSYITTETARQLSEAEGRRHRCLSAQSPLIAVGAHYSEFPELADATVIALVEERDQAMTRAPKD